METTKKTTKSTNVEPTEQAITETVTTETVQETTTVESRKPSTVTEKVKQTQKPSVPVAVSGELSARQKRNMSHQAIRQYYLNLSK
jgi:hypothetical protein